MRVGNPRRHSLAGLLRDFELHGSMRLLLHDNGATGHAGPVRDIPDAQPHEITGPELAVDREVKQRNLPGSLRELQADTDGPNILKAQRGLLSDQFALVPWLPLADKLKFLIHDTSPG